MRLPRAANRKYNWTTGGYVTLIIKNERKNPSMNTLLYPVRQDTPMVSSDCCFHATNRFTVLCAIASLLHV
ncbi:hypothetical protein QR680_001582 [Steinernema hermaphroditum]|uniref:Uncharacterized protein n=1 Tax=Steinernema hermaphroditum TaxID=289476 RepID=A0AA39GYX3_9BILA|nr:hypothetical protein QR680_001582 [Steinernema hermaphroditum]